MKLLLLVAVYFVVPAALADNSEEEEVWFAWIQARAECQIETRLSDITMAKTILGEKTKDPKAGEAALCILKKAGFINDEGKLHKEAIKKAIGDFFGDKTNTFLKKCVVEKSTPTETALHYLLCIRRLEQKLDKNFGSGPKTKA